MTCKFKRYYRLMLGMTCGAYLLQTTGCVEEILLPSVINIVLSTLLSLLFGTPLA